MKRKLIAIVSLILVMASIMMLPVNAAENEISVTPRYVNISSFAASIDVTDSGLAYCYSYIDTANSTHKIYLSMGLQQYDGSSWDTIKTWSTSGTGEISYTKSRYVADGYYYRTVATATIYTSGGSYVETATVYSPYT